MKIARFFACLFGIAGLLLMVGTAGLCFASLDAQPRVAEVPQEALDCAQTVVDAIAAGDFAGAEQNLYGQPDLGLGREPGTPEAAAIWQAFRDSVSIALPEKPYATDRGFARKVWISTMDLAAVTEDVGVQARTILNDRIAAAQTMEELYDESGDFRPDLIDAVMTQALEAALKEEREAVVTQTTMEMVHRDGRWWVLPDEALIRALGGSLE